MLVDALHLARSDGKPEQLRDLPAELFSYAQICDAPAERKMSPSPAPPGPWQQVQAQAHYYGQQQSAASAFSQQQGTPSAWQPPPQGARAASGKSASRQTAANPRFAIRSLVTSARTS